MYLAQTDTFPGYWGRGETPEEAIANMPHGKPGLLWEISPEFEDPRVDHWGAIVATFRAEYQHLAFAPRKECPPVVARGWKCGPRGGKRNELHRDEHGDWTD